MHNELETKSFLPNLFFQVSCLRKYSTLDGLHTIVIGISCTMSWVDGLF
jgi:hypothetical protein